MTLDHRYQGFQKTQPEIVVSQSVDRKRLPHYPCLSGHWVLSGMGNLDYQLSTEGPTLRLEISLRTQDPFLESSSRGFSRARDTRRETGREGNGQPV